MSDDSAWALFCEAFGFADLKNDARLRGNNDRVRARLDDARAARAPGAP